MGHPFTQVAAVEERQAGEGGKTGLPGSAGDGAERFQISAARAGQADRLAVDHLLAMEGDPLADVRALRQVRVVMKDGEIQDVMPNIHIQGQGRNGR